MSLLSNCSGSTQQPEPSNATTKANEFVRRTLGPELEEFPLDIRESLYERFRAEYASLMTNQMELVLHKRLTDDEVRHLMFSPTPAQYRHYASLLSLRSAEEGTAESQQSAAASTTQWLQVLQKRFVTLFYLKHARNWALVVEFILQNGLQVLVDQLLHPDLQLRGQAIDCFVQVTSNAAFDWFQDPVGYENRLLHSKMAALAMPPSRFLQSLVRNIQLYDPEVVDSNSGEDALNSESSLQSPSRLPGGTYVMLQVLASFLSWVRKFYSQPKSELRLSRELLELLRDWKQRTQTEEEGELELAKQVFDDFSRWSAVEDSEEGLQNTKSSNGALISATGASVGVGHGSNNTSDRTSESFFSFECVLQLLDTGDNCDRQEEDEARAIEVCSEAIAANLCVLDAYLMRARACVQRIERKALTSPQGRSSKSAASYDDVQCVLDDCAAVLRLDPTSVDARKYRLQVFSALEMWNEVQELLSEWVSSTNDMLERTFLPEDVEFFKQQHLNAIKLAKQEEIFQAILHRDGAGRPSKHVDSTAIDAARLDEPLSFELENPTQLETFSSSSSPSLELGHLTLGNGKRSSLLFKSASSSDTKGKNKSKRTAKAERTKDLQTEMMCRGHAFARKIRKAKSDPAALTKLLLSTSPAALTDAFESALGEEHFLAVFDALVQAKMISGDDKHSAEKAAGVLRLMVDSARFQLFVEMASENTRERIHSCAEDISDALLAASSADHESRLGEEAINAETATGSACA